MYDIVIGRSKKDKESFGVRGTIFLGKHYVKMGQTTSLSNKVFLDVTRSHVVFVCGKRGSGKSYSMGVIAEGISDLPKDISKNLSVIILDTMGIYWTMKYANQKDNHLLNQWGLDGKGLDVQIYTPTGYFKQYKKKGVPTDFPFSIKPSDLEPEDWCLAFSIPENDPMETLVERVIIKLKKSGKEYSVENILDEIQKDERTEKRVKDALENDFLNAVEWGVFDVKGTELEELAKPGEVSIIDVSCYSTLADSWNVKSLVIGLVSQKLFLERMIARKNEEYEAIHKAVHFFGDEEVEQKHESPLVWLILDEAHEFLPREGKTVATGPLITILREGRQPGISLVLASQQPGKIHQDVMTQSDVVIAHRVTAKVDADALGMLMQSYMREGLTEQLDNLPPEKGAAIIFDDINERLYPIRVRPRITWHGGEAPAAIPKTKKKFRL